MVRLTWDPFWRSPLTITKIMCVPPDGRVGKLGASWLQGWPDNSRSQVFENSMLPDCRVDLKTLLDEEVDLWYFSNDRVISSSSCSRVKIMILCLLSTQWFFLRPQSCWTSLRIFPVTNQKYMCNTLRLDYMHASLPI